MHVDKLAACMKMYAVLASRSHSSCLGMPCWRPASQANSHCRVEPCQEFTFEHTLKSSPHSPLGPH